MNCNCLWHALHSTNLACFLHLCWKWKGLKIKVTKCNKYICIYEFNPWSQYHNPERNDSPGKSYKDLTLSHSLFLIRCNWICARIKINHSLVQKYNIPASCYPYELSKSVQQRRNTQKAIINVAVNQGCPTFFCRDPQPLLGHICKNHSKWYNFMVRLSALRTGCLYPPGTIPGTHFCLRPC